MHTRYLWIALLIGLLMAACRPERKTVPGVLDINETAVARQTARVLTISPPVPTIAPTRRLVPTNTPPVPTAQQPTSTPLVDRSAYVRQSFLPGPWGTIFFTATDGTRYTLNEFTGRPVVIQTLSTVCQICQEQSQELGLAAQKLNEFGNADTVIFINLSIDRADTLDDLTTYQDTFGMESEDSITWITGLASPDLVRDLGNAFGDDVVDTSSGGFIFIDKYGFAHLSDEGFILANRLQEILLHFVGGPGIDEPTPDYNEEGTLLPTLPT